jgi:hypothetical protein
LGTADNFRSSEAVGDVSMDDQSPVSSDSEPSRITTVKFRIPPPLKGTLRTTAPLNKSKATGDDDADENDKTYAPAKRVQQRSESPIPWFALDEDGHEIIPEILPRITVSFLAFSSFKLKHS